MKLRTGRKIALALFLAGLIILLVGPFLVPVPELEGMVPAEALADPDSQFFEINGINVHVKTQGKGEPVFVLMHGFASSLYSWNEVMDPLSQYGTVISYDRTGFGLTERPLTWEGQNPYKPEAQVDMLISILDHYGVQKAILVGNSAGGTIAMQVTLAHPDRVAALVLVDPAVYTGGGTPSWLKPLLAVPQIKHLGPLFARQLLMRGPELINMAWHNPAKLSAEMLEDYQKPFRVENWDKALWEFTSASHSTDLVYRLDELNLPTLVITGDDDRIVPTADSIRLAGELPDASLVVIPDAGHVPHEEQPGAFMEAVSSFINKIQP